MAPKGAAAYCLNKSEWEPVRTKCNFLPETR